MRPSVVLELGLLLDVVAPHHVLDDAVDAAVLARQLVHPDLLLHRDPLLQVLDREEERLHGAQARPHVAQELRSLSNKTHKLDKRWGGVGYLLASG